MLAAALTAAAAVPTTATADTVIASATATGAEGYRACSPLGSSATTFVASTTATVRTITVYLSRNGSDGSATEIQLRPLVGGPGTAPAATVLASGVVPASQVPTNLTYPAQTITLATPVQVQAGTGYAVVSTRPSGQAACVSFALGASGFVAGGTAQNGYRTDANLVFQRNDLYRFAFSVNGDALACAGQTVAVPFGAPTSSAAASCTGETGLSYTVQSGPSHGMLGTVGADGKVTYTPQANYFGTDSYVVKANASNGATATYTVNVTVAKPTPPSCAGDALAVAFNTPATATFSCSGVGLAYSVVNAPARGTLAAISGNTVKYAPLGGVQGTDGFKVRATDIAGQTAEDTVAVTVGAPLDVTPDPDDQLTGQDADAHWDLDAGETDTFELACAPGDLAVDGRALVQQVDQGTGEPADVQTLERRRIDSRTFRFTLHNPATGRAQGHLAVACISETTFKGRKLAVRTAGGNTLQLTPGQTPIVPVCNPGETAIARGFAVTAGGNAAKVVETQSAPNTDGRGWYYVFTAAEPATVQLSGACLSYADAGSEVLVQSKLVTATATVAAGAMDRQAVDCPVGYVGLVGGYSTPSALAHLGQETQAKRRLFWFQNTSDAPQTATVSVLCVGLTTATTTSPVAPVGQPSPDPTPVTSAQAGAPTPLVGAPSIASVASRTLAVSSAGKTTVHVGCAGTVACAGKLSLSKGKTVLATATFTARPGTTTKVALKLTTKGRRLVKSAKGKRLAARLVIGAGAPVSVTLKG